MMNLVHKANHLLHLTSNLMFKCCPTQIIPVFSRVMLLEHLLPFFEHYL